MNILLFSIIYSADYLLSLLPIAEGIAELHSYVLLLSVFIFFIVSDIFLNIIDEDKLLYLTDDTTAKNYREHAKF